MINGFAFDILQFRAVGYNFAYNLHFAYSFTRGAATVSAEI